LLTPGLGYDRFLTYSFQLVYPRIPHCVGQLLTETANELTQIITSFNFEDNSLRPVSVIELIFLLAELFSLKIDIYLVAMYRRMMITIIIIIFHPLTARL
jgi:hypothetical protein